MLHKNKEAWNDLYGKTDKFVWSHAPIGFLEEFMPHVISLLDSGCNVLDAGAGEGRNQKTLLKTGARIYACDASLNAFQKLVRYIQENVQCLQCDLANMPFKSNSFQFVLLTDIIETMPEPNIVLNEINRILQPQGLLLCNIPGYDDGIAHIDMTPLPNSGYLYCGRYFYRFYEKKEAIELLEKCGIEILINKTCKWMEAPHPNFRAEIHEHTSLVFLARKPRN